MTDHYWALPDGISEALPDTAEALEHLRRELLDLFATWGYRLIMPPLVEFLESLRTGHGSELDLHTFKVVDPLSGRMMGIRADMTPQAVRIDAHKLPTAAPNRLCYIGSVLRTRSSHHNGSRAPIQLGAELFGHAGLDSDFEIIALGLAVLTHCRVPTLTLDIGHIGIFRALCNLAHLDADQTRTVQDILLRKSLPEVDAWLAASHLPSTVQDYFYHLPRLHGDIGILDTAQQVFATAPDSIHTALTHLQELVTRLQDHCPACTLHLDLGELSGYDYHSGIVFAAYTPGHGKAILNGGRYDGLGAAFGRARPATGFSSNLRTLASFVLSQHAPASRPRIFAPAVQDAALEERIRALRGAGQCVVRGLAGQDFTAADLGCEQQLVQRDGQWVVE